MKQMIETYRTIDDLERSLPFWNERGYRLSNIFWKSIENVVGSGYSTHTYSDYSIVVVYDKVEEGNGDE